MLVLTRKRMEMIRIGDDITIKVIRTGRSTVKLGIVAPDDVRVLRAELSLDPPDEPSRVAAIVERAVREEPGASAEFEEAELEEADLAEADEAQQERRLPEVDAGDLAQFAALIYPQAV